MLVNSWRLNGAMGNTIDFHTFHSIVFVLCCSEENNGAVSPRNELSWQKKTSRDCTGTLLEMMIIVKIIKRLEALEDGNPMMRRAGELANQLDPVRLHADQTVFERDQSGGAWQPPVHNESLPPVFKVQSVSHRF